MVQAKLAPQQYNLRVTGFPTSDKDSSLTQAVARLATCASDETLLCDRLSVTRFGTFLCKFRASAVSMRLPAQCKCASRWSLGKFSSLEMRLFDKSIESKSSRVAPRFSIMGMPMSRKTNSRSPSGLVRCSACDKSSAVILMVVFCIVLWC